MVVGVPPAIRPRDLPLREPTTSVPVGGENSLAELERRHIAAVLEHTGWNISWASDILQIDRGTVYNKIKKYGLHQEGRS
jgi:transcriptional regulator of acetoin/glycerol metabolism